MKKKNKLLILSFLILILAFVVFYLIIPIRKAPKKVEEKDVVSLESILLQSPTYKDIILEYKKETNLLVVFYNNSLPEAEKQVKEFFEENNIDEVSNQKIEYIGLNKGKDEPPAGFGQ
jgi:hypothetical protein